MSDLRELLEAARRAGVRGEAVVLATVVEVVGSAYRRPGARMLLTAAGESVGLVSGGCLEADLAERARAVLATGDAHTAVYDLRAPDEIWGLGLGCNGLIRVLLERLDPSGWPPYLEFIQSCLDLRLPGVVLSVFESTDPSAAPVGTRWVLRDPGPSPDASLREAVAAAFALRCSRVADGPGRRVLVEHVGPELHLVLCGAGQDARPLARIARQLGWRLTVLDPRAAYATRERFPEADVVLHVDCAALDPAACGIDAATAVVVMTHHFRNDLELLARLLPGPARYVGLLGPRRRALGLVAALSERGTVSPQELGRLYAPVGLDLGAEAPGEIALAITAEIQAVFAGRRGGFLRDRRAALHDEPGRVEACGNVGSRD